MVFASFILSTLLGLNIFDGSDDSGFPVFDEPQNTIIWHWEDSFSAEEKQKVVGWLRSVTRAVEEAVGVYPFELHMHIHRRGGSREPVPWANTRRFDHQGVDFYIDPSFSLQSFLEDWTAPHEISHLSIPYLGRQHSWFAEGYASFMQYQVMERMGIYTMDQVHSKYAEKVARVKRHYKRSQDFVSVARELQSRNMYADMYWGSASFFIKLDDALKSDYKSSLTELIKEYGQCCRLEEETIEEVLSSWDKILGSSSCSELLKTYQTVPASTLFEY